MTAQLNSEILQRPISVRNVADIEPWPYYDALRDQGPLVWDEAMKAWIVLDFDNCAYIETNEDKFRNAYVGVSPVVVQVKGGGANITLSSGELHDKIRRFHLKLFTPPLVESYRHNHVRPIIKMLLDRFQHKGQTNLCADFGDQIPPRVIAALLGMPWEDDDMIARILHLHEEIMKFLGSKFDEEGTKNALATSKEINDMLLPYIRARREHPKDDFISRVWLEAPKEYGPLSEEDAVGMCRELFLGGADTTVHGLANCFYLLLTNDEIRNAVQADRKTALSSCVEEAMRLYGSVMYRFRVANQDCELGGREVKKDQTLILLHSAANRDPQRYACPHMADLTRRPAADHLAFNKGPRACVGMGLARVEMRDAIEAVLDRLPNVRLDPGAEQPHFASLFMRSWRPLHVLFDA